MRRRGQSADNPARLREKGVALVLVLGLVALIGAWASTAAYEDMVALRRAENMQHAMRAVQASRSAFEVAKQALRQDAKDNPQQDDLDEDWALETPPFPLDDGLVSGRIIDANRFFNLNDLVDGTGKVQAQEVMIAKKLFSVLELDPNLVDALVDWMDADDRPQGSAGAEDAAYYDQAYRVKNTGMDRWDELGLIRGFDDEIISKLADDMIVRDISKTGLTSINLNTASRAVLLSLFLKMTDVDAEAWMVGRPYADVATALASQHWAAGVNTSRLSVTSDTFMVRTEARFGRAIMREEFMLLRQSEKLSLLSRERLPWARP